MSSITAKRNHALRSIEPVDELFERFEAASSLSDKRELLHEHAWNELEMGVSRKGVYAMALTSVDGDRERARARYLKLRVEQLESDFLNREEEDREEEDADRRLEEATADLRRTMFAIAVLVLALVAIISWS